jgi:hypothetical protein
MISSGADLPQQLWHDHHALLRQIAIVFVEI